MQLYLPFPISDSTNTNRYRYRCAAIAIAAPRMHTECSVSLWAAVTRPAVPPLVTAAGNSPGTFPSISPSLVP